MKQPGGRVGWDQETRSPGANERELHGSVGLVAAFLLIPTAAGRTRWSVAVRLSLTVRAIFSGWSVATRRAIWTRMAWAFVAISWRAVAAAWSFPTHASRAFVGIATWAIARGRALLSPTSAALLAITTRAIVVTTFGTEMAASFFTILPTHFVAVATAWL